MVAGVIVKDGTVLIAQRKDSHSQGGLWEFPGGKVEAGETDSIALVRELEEELDVIVSVRQSLGKTLTITRINQSVCVAIFVRWSLERCILTAIRKWPG